MNPLNAFADRWKLDGDTLRCRCCDRPQQVSWALHQFPHAARCEMARLPGQRPWVELQALLGAALAKAEPMKEEEHV